jgi:hypothetical protein
MSAVGPVVRSWKSACPRTAGGLHAPFINGRRLKKLWENNNPHALEFTRSVRIRISFGNRIIVGFDVGIYNPSYVYHIVI